MGLYLTNAVINGLEGKKFPSVVVKSKTDKERSLKFSANSLAMLVVIANGQPNPDFEEDGNTIFVAAPETMSRLAHFSTTCGDDNRALLKKLGLITHQRSMWHLDIDGSGQMKMYNNVYQINVRTIRKLNGDCTEKYWRKDILHIDNGKVAKMNAQQRKALALSDSWETSDAETETRHAETETRHAKTKTRHARTKTRHAGTNIYNTNKTNINTGDVVAFADDGEFDSLRNRIAEACRVDAAKVGRSGVRNAVSKKDPAEVDAIIAAFEPGTNTNNPVGLLLDNLKELPELNQEQLKKAIDDYLTRPLPDKDADQPKEDPFPGKLQAAWQTTVSKLKLNELSQEILIGLREEFENHFTNLENRGDHLGIIMDNLNYNKIIKAGDIVASMPDVNDRVKLLRDLIADRHD